MSKPPRRVVLLVDHGSRDPEAGRVLDQVAALLAERLPDRLVRTAHMELAAPDIADAVAECVAGGAREIDLVPYFLAPGRHGSGDVPRLAAEAAQGHPGLQLRVTAPLGAHPGLVDTILDRLLEDETPSRESDGGGGG